VEGTLAGAAATLLAWALLAAASGQRLGAVSWAKLWGATMLSSLFEAVTPQLDNLFVPLHYYAVLGSLGV
jgi:dolichol kinase